MDRWGQAVVESLQVDSRSTNRARDAITLEVRTYQVRWRRSSWSENPRANTGRRGSSDMGGLNGTDMDGRTSGEN